MRQHGDRLPHTARRCQQQRFVRMRGRYYRGTTTTRAVSPCPVDAMTLTSVVPGDTPTTVQPASARETLAIRGDDTLQEATRGGVIGLPPERVPTNRVVSPTRTVARAGSSVITTGGSVTASGRSFPHEPTVHRRPSAPTWSEWRTQNRQVFRKTIVGSQFRALESMSPHRKCADRDTMRGEKSSCIGFGQRSHCSSEHKRRTDQRAT